MIHCRNETGLIITSSGKLHRDDGDLAAAARDEALWVQLRPEGRAQDMSRRSALVQR